jgi:two-component system OmpR family response regulator
MRKMLIADDERVIAFALQAWFEIHGFDVEIATTPEQAMERIDRKRFDVVIADLRLSGTEAMEGLEVIRAAREQNAQAVIMLLTAYLIPEVVEAAKAAGADVAVQKPRPLAEVTRTIMALLER